MTVVDPNNYVKDTDSWVHSTFIVSLGNDGFGNPLDYATYTRIVENSCKDEIYGSVADPKLDKNMASVLSSATDGSGALPVYFSHSKCRDTTLGGNDAINCYYQYNETDDPPHPFTMSETRASEGMGRVYSETIDDHQQLIYLTFGIPVFNNLADFYKQAADQSMANLVNTGTDDTLLQQLASMASKAKTALVTLPSLPIAWLELVLKSFTNVPITKYYDFSNQMGQYYKYVQSILTQISVNMGFMNDATFLDGTPTGTPTGTGGVINDLTSNEQAIGSGSVDTAYGGTPDMFKRYHMDIYQIMLRRAAFLSYTGGSYPSNDLTTDQIAYATAKATKARNDDKSTWGKFVSTLWNPLGDAIAGYSATIYNATLYIGLRIEKSTDSSESISNQIGQPAIAGFINSKTQAARDIRFNTMYGSSNSSTIESLGKFLGNAVDFAEQTVNNTAGIEGLTALATGSGMVDIPDVWKDSSVSKNYSFNLRLRAPYGDPLSIVQSLYVPLALVLAGCMPRAIGASSYSTPFVCRAYCKGMFAVPLGMIESVTIKRGSDVNGWTYQRLPTELDISFTIKDLSPCMYMSLGDLTTNEVSFNPAKLISQLAINPWNVIFGTNSTFQEYLLTLSGMGLAERSLWILNFKRRVQLFIQTQFDTILNPAYWGVTAGGSGVNRVITAIIPTTKIPKN